MTREETIKILAILRQAYPQSQTVDAKAQVALWADQFAQYSAEDVYTAVKKYISTGRFMPTVADIKSKLAPPESLWDLCMDLRMDNDFAELKLETAPYNQMEKVVRRLKYGLDMEPGELLAGHIRSELARWEKRRKAELAGERYAIKG